MVVADDKAGAEKQVNAEFTGLARRFADAYPDTDKRFTAGLVEPLIKTYTPKPLRAKELAIRSSLGATRVRLVRQMLTESLLVASIGAALGIGLAYLSIDWLTATVRNLDTPPPSWITFDVDARVLAVTVVATIGAALASGLLPAWMASRNNVVEVLRGERPCI